jgi:hypothetical protein
MDSLNLFIFFHGELGHLVIKSSSLKNDGQQNLESGGSTKKYVLSFFTFRFTIRLKNKFYYLNCLFSYGSNCSKINVIFLNIPLQAAVFFHGKICACQQHVCTDCTYCTYTWNYHHSDHHHHHHHHTLTMYM